MTITHSRVTQYIAILLILGALGAGYWYFSARAGTKLQQSTSVQMSTNLVGYWSFDGDDISGTTAYDRSGNGYNGTLNGGTTKETGKLGQALAFDGVDDSVSANDTAAFDLTNAITVSAWVYGHSWTALGRYIVAKSDRNNGLNEEYRNYDFYVDVNGKLNFYFLDQGAVGDPEGLAISDGALATNQWYFVSATYDRTNIKLYIDGVLVKTVAETDAMTGNTTHLGIGRCIRDGNSNYGSWDGSLDEVRIYNTALTASQIYDLYKLGGETVGASTPTRDSLNEGLAGYWKLDDASGTTAVDSSTNANNGTLTNGPTWGTGQIGGATTFDGADDYINVGTAPNIANKSFTISTWTKRNTTGVAHWLISQGSGSAGNGLHFGFLSNNKVRCSFYNAAYDLDTPSSYTDSNWHLWTCTYDADSNTKKIFQDGVFLVSGTVPSDYAGSGALKVGAFLDGTTVLNGQLDEVRVYNRSLSADEITKLYKTTTPSNPDTRLKGYWSFDGDSLSGTTARDLSGAGNNGTLTNGPTTDPGIRGQAMSFDGSDDFAAITSGPSIANASFTISAWAKRGSTGAHHYILGQGTNTNNQGLHFGFRDTNVFTFAFWLNDLDTIAVYTDLDWHQWTATYDASTNARKIYRDGVIVASDTASVDYGGSGALDIGDREVDANGRFSGSIDEVRIYNAVLSASEIYNLYQEGGVKVNKSQSNNGDSLNDGLAGYWKLDDASGTTATDSSGNGYNGTLTNGPTWGTGQIGGAVTLDGTDDYINIPDSAMLDIGTEMTYSVWIKPTTISLPGQVPIMRKWQFGAEDKSLVLSSNGGNISFYLYNSFGGTNLTANAQVVANVWTHIVATYNGTTAILYVNGKNVASKAASGDVADGAGNLIIGFSTEGGSWYFPGNIDEIRTYNRSLSADEVSRLYKTTSPTNPETGLVGYWSFNGKDLAGTTAYDRSGKGNNGTLTNGPTTDPGKIGQALTFDGSDDYVNLGDMPSIEGQSAVTFAGWLKPTVLVDWAPLVSKYATNTDDITLNEGAGLTGNNTQLVASIRSGTNAYGYTATGKLSAGNWTHVAMVFDGTQTGNSNRLKIYVNGVAETLTFSGTIPATTTSNNQNVLIGRTGVAFDYFNGVLDEVRIYNRALSTTEITALYNFGR